MGSSSHDIDPHVHSSQHTLPRSFLLLTLLTGVVYPLVITVIGKVAFSSQAEGSLIGKDGRPVRDESAAVGSSLIGQTFDQPQYFWSRPSRHVAHGV